MYCSGCASMTFPIDQLDIKRKQIPKYGKDLAIKLNFTADKEVLKTSRSRLDRGYSSAHCSAIDQIELRNVTETATFL